MAITQRPEIPPPGCPFCGSMVRVAYNHSMLHWCGTRVKNDGTEPRQAHHCRRKVFAKQHEANGKFLAEARELIETVVSETYDEPTHRMDAQGASLDKDTRDDLKAFLKKTTPPTTGEKK